MLTDRELLEMAAKAAGVELQEWTGDDPTIPNRYWSPTEQCYWNPLIADGDALRLAVVLQLNVHVVNEGTFVSRYEDEPVIAEKRGSDPGAAARRAIVRAAASIGEKA